MTDLSDQNKDGLRPFRRFSALSFIISFVVIILIMLLSIWVDDIPEAIKKVGFTAGLMAFVSLMVFNVFKEKKQEDITEQFIKEITISEPEDYCCEYHMEMVIRKIKENNYRIIKGE